MSSVNPEISNILATQDGAELKRYLDVFELHCHLRNDQHLLSTEQRYKRYAFCESRYLTQCKVSSSLGLNMQTLARFTLSAQ